MIVDSAQVAMNGSNEAFSMTSYKKTSGVETKTVSEWMNELAPEELGLAPAENDPVSLNISQESKRAAEMSSVNPYGNIFQYMEDLKIQLMQAMFRMLTGKDMPLTRMTPQQESSNPMDKAWERYARQNAAKADTQLSGRLADGRIIVGSEKDLSERKLRMNVTRESETTYAREAMQFSMAAQVKTADGKSIDVELNVSMSQEFYSRVDTVIAENVVDPLVVNFGAAAAQLTSTKFNFDLDCDGTSDQISQLEAGSGFLAVDWDGSGEVKDGSQLFGTQSGDGFADLAKHDSDGSGWIDENDPIFDKLRVWMWDDSGGSKLLTLGEVGVGAIYLGKVDTNYSLQQQGQNNGYIRSTGFFLREDGTAGTVQHVDLVV